ncbi:MTOR-associated protein MEAK7 [Paramormyrops kingsleyae]|uniref:MTOR-associated protein MEAK7 n=1 Tax=Paramormyrops kingsleyae TaxID=1676925 RepID=A0A3B3RLY4_9TELE|nr:TLD domain-containing protein 1 [Paramormyrops kingsleyae]XP_023683140.1 TLD domain-containing protein 1 [Paramormyrops kingsleyae]XP_023683141.1 TLD domain-containing protein 1 [Paramormyrops kingsleyae]
MGNAESVVAQKRLARFRPDERPVIEKVFDRLQEAGSARKVLTLDALKLSVRDAAPTSMTARLFQSMRSADTAVPAADSGGVTREQMLVFLADVLRGTAEERAPLVVAMAGVSEGSVVTVTQIREFLEDLISAVVQCLIHSGQLQGWKPDRMQDSDRGVKLLAEQLCSELKCTDQQVCDIPCLENWLFRTSVPLYLEFLSMEALGICLPSRPPLVLLPPCQDVPWRELRSILDLPLLLFLAPQLPDTKGAPWRLLFSSRLHGESFTRLLRGCTCQGPSVLLIRDTDGYTFGGFASQSWDTRPQFQGDSRCFLFSVTPSLRLYTCTGYNQNYMYLNHGQQTMPNGLGMGGQHDYFGLWLDSDYGQGHSRARPRCTTYGSPQLSGQENFTLDALEVWGVGEPPENQQTQVKRSILDADPEAQIMMEMAGKTRHSQGLREPEEGEQD